MDKFARKKSEDPAQEKLRSAKDRWNQLAKEFISRMIAFKRALNGRGDQTYSLPPSNIKDPFPPNIGSFLNELSSNFEYLANEASRIQQEQAAYSQSRRKKVASSPQILIASHTFPTLLAVSAEEQEQGLMGKTWPPPIMSFVYSSPKFNKFWMKNTPSPLDIVFALDNKIVAIHQGEPNSTKLVGGELSNLVVELPLGTCQKLGIKIGDPVKLL